MRSWYHPDKEVAEPEYFGPWDPELWKRLQKGDVIVGEFHYHLTRTGRTVERWNKAIDKVGFSPLEATHRRNLHIRRKNLEDPVPEGRDPTVTAKKIRAVSTIG